MVSIAMAVLLQRRDEGWTMREGIQETTSRGGRGARAYTCTGPSQACIHKSADFIPFPVKGRILMCYTNHMHTHTCTHACMYTCTHTPCLSVSNDKLPLSPPNGHEGVHSFDTCHHGLPHRDAGNDARSLCAHTSTGLCLNGALSRTGGDTQQREP